MRNRASAILIENNQVALIKRIKSGETYYVFPGGGIEYGETPEEATKRETFEEFGVEIAVKNCFVEVEYNGRQYFFLATIEGGQFGSGQGAELFDESKGMYIPLWVNISDLTYLHVIPKKVLHLSTEKKK